jgi:hypothetical protein
MLHRFHGLETFIDRRVEIPDGLTASSTTHRMQSEGVFIAIVSIVVATVVAAAIVVASFVAIVAVAVRAFGSPLLGLLVPNVEVVIFDGRPRARATIVSFDGVARCKRSNRDTPSAMDAGGPLDG